MRSLLLLLLCVLLVLGADKGVRGDAFAKDNKNSDATIAVSVSSDGHAEARLSGAGNDDTGKEPKRQAASPWPPLSDNLKFYNDLIPSRPQGAKLSTIHGTWKGKWELLERHHGYIQWLFPLREPGTNNEAQTLQPHEEAEFTRQSAAGDALGRRLVASLDVMLDFYGLLRVDDDAALPCKVRVVRNQQTAAARLRHMAEQYAKSNPHHATVLPAAVILHSPLHNSPHNWLRATRIIKSLHLLGHPALAVAFAERLAIEAFTAQGLLRRALKSCMDYWVPAALEGCTSKAEHQELLQWLTTRVEHLAAGT